MLKKTIILALSSGGSAVVKTKLKHPLQSIPTYKNTNTTYAWSSSLAISTSAMGKNSGWILQQAPLGHHLPPHAHLDLSDRPRRVAVKCRPRLWKPLKGEGLPPMSQHMTCI